MKKVAASGSLPNAPSCRAFKQQWRPGREQAACQAMGFDDLSERVGHHQLKQAFCKIDGNVSSAHLELPPQLIVADT